MLGRWKLGQVRACRRAGEDLTAGSGKLSIALGGGGRDREGARRAAAAHLRPGPLRAGFRPAEPPESGPPGEDIRPMAQRGRDGTSSARLAGRPTLFTWRLSLARGLDDPWDGGSHLVLPRRLPASRRCHAAPERPCADPRVSHQPTVPTMPTLPSVKTPVPTNPRGMRWRPGYLYTPSSFVRSWTYTNAFFHPSGNYSSAQAMDFGSAAYGKPWREGASSTSTPSFAF